METEVKNKIYYRWIKGEKLGYDEIFEDEIVDD